jgi:putative FmdB family regulatory protein
MPTYDYQCDACNHTFEEFQSMMDKRLKKCPQCKKPKLRRLIGTGAAIIFKGSGFYQTDYRSEAYKSAAKAEESKSSSNGDSKSKLADKADSTGANQSPAAATAPKKAKP